MGIPYSRASHFQRDHDDDDVRYAGVRDHEMCDDDHVHDCAVRYESGLPSSAACRAPSQAIRS